MNHHLNLFRFFNESTEKEFIENNLSRAFALCLCNSSFFLNEYIKAIVSPDDYRYLFSSITNDTKYFIDIQIDTATIERESYRKVYAVAMTSDVSLNLSDFFLQNKIIGKKNITDILITVKDVLIIIEVKRTLEDCKAQLYNQILPFLPLLDKHGKDYIIPIAYSWQEVVKLLERVKNVQQLASQNSIFISDFLELSEIKYPNWFEPQPFNVIQFLTQEKIPNNIQLMKRMRQALVGVSAIAGDAYQPLRYKDRVGISVPFGWASEIIPKFEISNDLVKDYIVFNIWPGNTKQQGLAIFEKPLDWIRKKNLVISGKEYNVSINYCIQFRHFNRDVSSISFSDEDTNFDNKLHTQQNFYKQSGKWERVPSYVDNNFKLSFDNQTGKWNSNSWVDFEHLLDQHFKNEFNWRDKCQWDDKFINSERNYFNMSLGFEVSLYIPFEIFKNIDKKETDILEVSKFLKTIIDALRTVCKV